jgi:alpha-N-arabinofuranosidase
MDLDRFIEGVVATADHVRAVGHHKKRINISLDEWNVWYQQRFVSEEKLEILERPHLIEDQYNVPTPSWSGTSSSPCCATPTAYVIGCLRSSVNVIAPIRTDANGAAWKQTTFTPFALTSRTDGATSSGQRSKSGQRHPPGSGTRRSGRRCYSERAWRGDAVRCQPRQSEPLALSVDLRALSDLVVGEHTAV